MTTKQMPDIFKLQAAQWADQFDVCCVLDNNECANAFGLNEIEFAVAAGITDSITGNEKDDWDKLKKFIDKHSQNSPVFGYFSYDLKNQLENLVSEHDDKILFPSLYFFVPEHVILIDNNEQLMVMSEDADGIMNKIKAQEIKAYHHKPVTLLQKVSKKSYVKNVEAIKEHIIAGDVYELNYCIEFFAENVDLNPLQTYFRLKQNSPTPFGAYFKLNNKYLMCASPERFIKKTLNKLYSQPIKGTVKRSDNSQLDEQLKKELYNSEKEKAENLMIVDLVRNDLAKSSLTGSVKVEELYGIYSFKQVHQMISTVSSTIADGLHPVEAIEHAFPMGSMTGAPKVMAMKLIEKYETTKRGLYSGALGYFAPNEDFDFNVVIRSIQFNSLHKYINVGVGSAITFDSDAEKEYEECLLKAEAMISALS
ncbi:MAG: anthranilate synthase component I family protein [Bacteroidia bacterium]|nr:anthranilate synthase component I family protein [Bacteroidia bacterium]